MKKFKLILTVLVAFILTIATFAGQYQAQSFMFNGGYTGSSTAFFGSTNTGTFYYDDSYNTNRSYTVLRNGTAEGPYVPLSTNSVTGALQASFETPIRVGDIAGGGTATNAAISVYYTRGIGLTNQATMSFVRSGNNGETYDTNTVFTITLDMPAAAAPATVVTNVPPWFLIGASHLRLWKITTGTNTEVAGAPYSFIVVNANLSTFVP